MRLPSSWCLLGPLIEPSIRVPWINHNAAENSACSLQSGPILHYTV
uniref:Uncharacterized protein n=1 Tax=Arundo donax TaxID=35708 RepID=A0A0A9CIQ3_ARUDO